MQSKTHIIIHFSNPHNLLLLCLRIGIINRTDCILHPENTTMGNISH